ncbi:MAG: phage tail protein [Oscillospiraceae bacterium]|nr:phage tail protein [Oscillospiraceae bacterium]MBR2422016.1 phage tail protein [Oscillospiraceae bacterium]
MASTETNKIHYDLVDVHVAPLTITDGVVSYGTPEKLPGAISMDLSAQGDTVKLRADGIVYYQSASNNGYEGDLNLAMVPDWFRTKYLGEQITEADKVLVENAAAEPQPFALLYGFKYDKKQRRHVLFSCMASRPNVKGENKDNQKEPDTESVNLSCVSLPNGDVKASTTEATPEATVTGWYKQVWQKPETTAEE